MSDLLETLTDESGHIRPHALADLLHTSIDDIAAMSGLSTDTLAKESRYRANTTQRRLRDILMIINLALPWSGSPMQSYVWFRSESLPSFGGFTAEELVKRGMAKAVINYIERVNEGGYT